jgi:transposase, IS5 family
LRGYQGDNWRMQNSLFDLENRYASLSQTGDPLERLNAMVDWGIFLPILERMDVKPRKSKAGRPVTCRIVMFKMLILQRLHALSDERLQYQVTDRLSFMRFLGVELAGKVPDARTVWAFRESLKEHDLGDALFDRLTQALVVLGVELKSGQIIDATFVPVPIQRNGREENELIKAGAVPLDWAPSGENKHKLAHKDVDARWTKKGGQKHYGYKSHINIDKDTKLITGQACTDASVHDSQVFEQVLRSGEQGGSKVWADSAYRSKAQEQSLQDTGHTSEIHERGYRGKVLDEHQKASNTVKSRVRARVEHVFGHMENAMGGIGLRTIGLARAKLGVVLMNLTYNLSRVGVLIRQGVFGFGRVSASKSEVTR